MLRFYGAIFLANSRRKSGHNTLAVPDMSATRPDKSLSLALMIDSCAVHHKVCRLVKSFRDRIFRKSFLYSRYIIKSTKTLVLYTLSRPESSQFFKLSKLMNGSELNQAEHIVEIS